MTVKKLRLIVSFLKYLEIGTINRSGILNIHLIFINTFLFKFNGKIKNLQTLNIISE